MLPGLHVLSSLPCIGVAVPHCLPGSLVPGPASFSTLCSSEPACAMLHNSDALSMSTCCTAQLLHRGHSSYSMESGLLTDSLHCSDDLQSLSDVLHHYYCIAGSISVNPRIIPAPAKPLGKLPLFGTKSCYPFRRCWANTCYRNRPQAGRPNRRANRAYCPGLLLLALHIVFGKFVTHMLNHSPLYGTGQPAATACGTSRAHAASTHISHALRG